VPNEPIPIKRPRPLTGPEEFEAGLSTLGIDPLKMKEALDLLERMSPLISSLTEGDKKKKKNRAAPGGDEPTGSPAQWRILYGLIVIISMIFGSFEFIGPTQKTKEQLDRVEQTQAEAATALTAAASSIESVEKTVDNMHSDYEALERAFVDYVQSDSAPDTRVPDSVIIIRDKHSRSR